MAVAFLQLFLCVLLAQELIFPHVLYAQMSHIECVPMELLFNFRNVHSLFGMKRMPLDSLRWIMFHTPLNSEQHLYSGLLDAVLWVHACSLGGGGRWGLGEWMWPWEASRPSKNHSLISWPIRYSNTGPSWESWDLLENATDSLKSTGEITTLFISPPETCAKSASCTSLCTGPLKARAEPVSERITCINGALTDMLKLCVPAGTCSLG